jgi:hypothetical protein
VAQHCIVRYNKPVQSTSAVLTIEIYVYFSSNAAKGGCLANLLLLVMLLLLVANALDRSVSQPLRNGRRLTQPSNCPPLLPRMKALLLQLLPHSPLPLPLPCST